MSLPRGLLIAIGLWPPTCAQEGSWRRKLFDAYTAWSIGTLVLEALGQSVSALKYWGDLHIVTMNSCVMVTVVSGIFKASNFVYTRDRLFALLRRLDENLDRFGKRELSTQNAIMKGAIRRAQFMFSTFLFIGGVALFFFWFIPIFQNIQDYQQPINLTDVTDAKKSRPGKNLPIIAWYPYDSISSPNYELSYINQCYQLMLIYLTTSTLDTFYNTVIIYLSAQMKILNHHLSTLRCSLEQQRQVTVTGMQEVFNVINKRQDIVTKTSYKTENDDDEEVMYKRLVEFLRMHQTMIECVEDFDVMLSTAILTQFLASTVVICLTAFVVTVTEDKGNIPTYLTYLMTMLIEVFLYCWYGDEIMEESFRLKHSAYSCGWTDAPLRFRTSLKIIMERAHRPAKLTAGKFYSISRVTYLNLLQGSYSYFAVLHQVNDRA